jgi:hypothetical protein
MVERVLDKDRANFCELFDPSDRPATGLAVASEETLRKAAEDLFK